MFKQLLILLLGISLLVSACQKTTYTYKTVGDYNILADVHVPEPISEKYPVIFATHGGGYIVGDRAGGVAPQELTEALLRGWVVISIDYRLSPGALIDEILEDVQDAWDWVHYELAQKLPLDLDRTTVVGGSAGGGLALINGYMLNPRPKVVVSFYPFCADFTDPYFYNPKSALPDSLVSEANNFRQTISGYTAVASSPRWQLFSNALASQKLGWMLTTRDQNEPKERIILKLIELSAVYNVDEFYPPTYLVHGLDDSLVPYTQSVQMARVLAAKNIIYKLDLVPGADHGFDFNAAPSMWIDHVLPAINFAAQHMNIETNA